VAQIVHEVVVINQPPALPNFRWLAHCNGCGFEARGPKPAVLEGSVMSHFAATGTPEDVKVFNENLKKAIDEAAKQDAEQEAAEKAAAERAVTDTAKTDEAKQPAPTGEQAPATPTGLAQDSSTKPATKGRSH
jgi:hypothetical protein